MALIKVKSIEELNLRGKSINAGDHGEIYEFDSTHYFKRINDADGLLNNTTNYQRKNILEFLMKFKGTKHLVFPEDIYVTKEQLLGYTSVKKDAKPLASLDDDARLADVLKSFKVLLKELKILANGGVFNYDLSPDNVLFDKEMWVIDFDESSYNKKLSYERMVLRLFQTVRDSIVGDCYASPLLRQRDLEELYRQFVSYESLDYDAYFRLLISNAEYANYFKRIKTVGDLRRSLEIAKKNL